MDARIWRYPLATNEVSPHQINPVENTRKMKNHKLHKLVATLFLVASAVLPLQGMGYSSSDARASSRPLRRFPDGSKTLQQVIDENESTGARIRLAGNRTYTFDNVELSSNIHLQIPSTVTIETNSSTGVLFRIGSSTSEVRNASITGRGGRFTINLTNRSPQDRIRPILTQWANNVLLQNINITDRQTFFNGITSTEPANNRFTRRLTVRNVSLFAAEGGFGLYQCGRVEDAVFENIASTGGIALRLETQTARTNTGVRDVTANNVRGRNGRAALSLSPHEADSSDVNVTNVNSNGCAYGVLVVNGFGSRVGDFSDTTVTDVTATYTCDQARETLFRRAQAHTNSQWTKLLGLPSNTGRTRAQLENRGADGENLAGPSLFGILLQRGSEEGVTIDGRLRYRSFPSGVIRFGRNRTPFGSSAVRRVNALN